MSIGGARASGPTRPFPGLQNFKQSGGQGGVSVAVTLRSRVTSFSNSHCVQERVRARPGFAETQLQCEQHDSSEADASDVSLHLQLLPVLSPLREVLNAILDGSARGSIWAQLVEVGDALEVLIAGQILAHPSDVLAQNTGGTENPLMAAGEQIPPWSQAVDSIHAILEELATYPVSFIEINPGSGNRGSPEQTLGNDGGIVIAITVWETIAGDKNRLHREPEQQDDQGAQHRGNLRLVSRIAATGADDYLQSTWRSTSCNSGDQQP
eukprot:s5149_g6.t1